MRTGVSGMSGARDVLGLELLERSEGGWSDRPGRRARSTVARRPERRAREVAPDKRRPRPPRQVEARTEGGEVIRLGRPQRAVVKLFQPLAYISYGELDKVSRDATFDVRKVTPTHGEFPTQHRPERQP